MTTTKVRLKGIEWVLLLGVAAISGCGGGQIRQDPIPQTTSTPTVQEPRIHSSGTIMVRYEGVEVPHQPQAPNEDGPYVFRSIDLDEGKQLSGSTPAMDLSAAVNARSLTVSLSPASGLRAVDAGKSAMDSTQCQSALSNAQGPLNFVGRQAPTSYVCLKTNEGRLCRLRVLKVAPEPEKQPAFMTITATFEYTTWESSP